MRGVQFDYSMEKESARQRSCIQKSKDERRKVESVHGVRAEGRVERAGNRDKVAGIRDRSGARGRLLTGSVVMWVMREFLWAGEFQGRKHPGRRVRKFEDVFGWMGQTLVRHAGQLLRPTWSHLSTQSLWKA